MWEREVLKDFDLSLHIIMVLIPGSESQYGNSASYQVSILVIYPGTDEWFYGPTQLTVIQT